MALTKHQFKEFFNLIGGLNTVKSALQLDTSDARDLQDIDFFPIGGISKRNGYATLNTLPISAASCTGLFMARYSTAGGTNLAFLVSGTELYSMPASLNGTWTDATNGLTITTGANNIWSFDLLNDITVLGNGTDTPISINSSGTASAFSGQPFTTFKFCVQSRGYMFYFVPTVGGNVLYDRGYFSNINDPLTVGTNNFINVGVGTGGGVTGAVDYKSYLYIFKRGGIFQATFQPTAVNSSGTLFPWTQFPNPVVPGVGTQSYRSIVKFTTPATHATPGEELVFFIDQFGVPRIFDGATTLSFASKIGYSRDSTILSLSNMDNTRLPYSFAINYPSKNRILFFLSKVNSQQDQCWVLDYSTGFAISRYKYASAFNVGALFEKSDGTFKPYFGDYAGGVFQSDQGTSDNGQPINDYYVTGDFSLKTPFKNSKWFFMDMRGQNGSISQNTKISFYLDGSDSTGLSDTKSLADAQTTWGNFIWGQASWAKLGMVNRTQEINVTSKTLRIKVESNSKLTDTMILEGFGVAAEELGTSQN